MLIKNKTTGEQAQHTELFPNTAFAAGDTDITAEWLNANNCEQVIIPPAPVDEVAVARGIALSRLAELDLKVPRGLEDFMAASGFNTALLPQITQDVLAEKAALRGEL